METPASLSWRASLARWTLALVIAAATVEFLVVVLAALRVKVSLQTLENGEVHVVSYLQLGRLLAARPWFEMTLPFVAMAAVCWMLWQDSAHRVLSELDASYAAAHPHSRVWWWFVPGANLVIPYRSVRDIYRGSAAINDQGSSSGLLLWWWVTLWLGFACAVAAKILLMRLRADSVQRVPSWTIAALCWRDVFFITSAALATVIVGSIVPLLTFQSGPRGNAHNGTNAHRSWSEVLPTDPTS